MVLVAILTVPVAAAAEFRDFERRAAAVLARHGGRIEQAVVVPGDGTLFREVHLVRFPGPDAYAAYRADPDLAALASLRARVVTHTELLAGEDGPRYHEAHQG
jgi:uncharacterized protein (DUF1330 family)